MDKSLANKLFVYRDGSLYWRVSPAVNVKSGSLVKSVNKQGYIRACYQGRMYYAHRLVFLMHHGYEPEIVDHINGDKSDNRIENLRGCTLAQNAQNSKMPSRNTSGVKGVCWHKRFKSWQVSVRCSGKNHYIGRFDCLELAELVASEARSKFHGEFARDV